MRQKTQAPSRATTFELLLIPTSRLELSYIAVRFATVGTKTGTVPGANESKGLVSAVPSILPPSNLQMMKTQPRTTISFSKDPTNFAPSMVSKYIASAVILTSQQPSKQFNSRAFQLFQKVVPTITSTQSPPYIVSFCSAPSSAPIHPGLSGANNSTLGLLASSVLPPSTPALTIFIPGKFSPSLYKVDPQSPQK